MAMASGTARTATTLTIAQMAMAIPLRTGRAASTQMGTGGPTPTSLGESRTGPTQNRRCPRRELDEDGDGYGDNSAGQYPDSCTNKNQETRRSTGTVARTKTEKVG